MLRFVSYIINLYDDDDDDDNDLSVCSELMQCLALTFINHITTYCSHSTDSALRALIDCASTCSVSFLTNDEHRISCLYANCLSKLHDKVTLDVNICMSVRK